MQAYFDISMRLLDPAVRSTLFPMDRPVYTRVQEEFPVKYGLSAAVSNSLVADGCIIEARGLRPGDVLPMESELEAMFNVSRTTCLLYTSACHGAVLQRIPL